MSLKARIEAVLFLTDKPVRAAAIAKIVNEDVDLVRRALLELVQDYETRDGALEISSDDGYIVQVKDEYASIIDEFLPVEMSAAHIRTLSAIAIKQPIPQSEIIKIRGAGAYEHIKELLEKELINRDETQGGRSPILSTTKKFQEYFRLTKDAKSLRQMLRKQDKPEGEAAEGIIPEGEVEGYEAEAAQQLLLMAESIANEAQSPEQLMDGEAVASTEVVVQETEIMAGTEVIAEVTEVAVVTEVEQVVEASEESDDLEDDSDDDDSDEDLDEADEVDAEDDSDDDDSDDDDESEDDSDDSDDDDLDEADEVVAKDSKDDLDDDDSDEDEESDEGTTSFAPQPSSYNVTSGSTGDFSV